MSKAEDESHLGPTFNMWGFVPPHMLLGRADFGSQHSSQRKDEERRREREYFLLMTQQRLMFTLH